MTDLTDVSAISCDVFLLHRVQSIRNVMEFPELSPASNKCQFEFDAADKELIIILERVGVRIDIASSMLIFFFYFNT